MEETNITINFDAAKLDALEFALRKQRSSAQRRMAEMLQQLYEAEVPEAVREYVDSKTAPAPRPKRPPKAAKPQAASAEIKHALPAVAPAGSGAVKEVK